MSINKQFGDQLREARKGHNLSAEKLAKSCGISRSYVTLMETGRRLPSRKMIPLIADALGLPVNIIVNWYLEDLRAKLVK